MDMAANPSLIQFLDTQQKNTNLDLDFLPPSLLFALGNWRLRAGTLTGYQNTTFRLLHPLDTIIPKLLRIDRDKFTKKDWPDIIETMRIFHPSETTLKILLTENPLRYRLPSIQANALKRNTSKFLEKFLPKTKYQEIVKTAEATYETSLRNAGIAPLSTINMPQKFPLKTKKHETPEL